MDLSVALVVIGTLLAILAAIPPLRTYYLLHVAVVMIGIGVVLSMGVIKT